MAPHNSGFKKLVPRYSMYSIHGEKFSFLGLEVKRF